MAWLVIAFALSLAQPPSVRIGFVGDVSFGGRSDTPGAIFAAVARDLAAPELTLANLEGLLLEGGAPRYHEARLDISASPRFAAALAASGIDLFGTANNHSWDAGAAGLREHLGHLARVRTFGSGATEGEAFAPVRETTAVGCIAFIPATLKSNRAREDGAAVAWYGAHGARPVSALTALVTAERAAGCAPVVSIHWGREGRPTPDADVQEVGHALVDAGAALVVGHHPHVLQGIEWRVGPHGPAAIAWSLGNFVFKNRDPDKRRSGMLEATFTRPDADEPAALAALAFVPMTIDVATFTPRPATPAEAAETRRSLVTRSAGSGTRVTLEAGRLSLAPGPASLEQAH